MRQSFYRSAVSGPVPAEVRLDPEHHSGSRGIQTFLMHGYSASLRKAVSKL